jgi:hypothetical protein
MAIMLENLTDKDKGRWVEYVSPHNNVEQGRIKSWNDKWIFVVYKCDNNWDSYTNYTGCATSPEDLNFKETGDNHGKDKKESNQEKG